MPKPGKKAEAGDSALLEPSLIALRKALAGSRSSREQQVPLHGLPTRGSRTWRSLRETDQGGGDTVLLIGAGAPAGGG